MLRKNQIDRKMRYGFAFVWTRSFVYASRRPCLHARGVVLCNVVLWEVGYFAVCLHCIEVAEIHLVTGSQSLHNDRQARHGHGCLTFNHNETGSHLEGTGLISLARAAANADYSKDLCSAGS